MTGGVGKQRKNPDHSDYTFTKIDKKMSCGEMKRTFITYIPVKDHQQKLA